MPWFEFTDDYRHVHGPSSVTMYAKGRVKFVTQALADEARMKGKGREIPRPRGMKAGKDGEPVEAQEPEVTQAFIHEEEPQESEDDGDDEGSQPDTP